MNDPFATEYKLNPPLPFRTVNRRLGMIVRLQAIPFGMDANGYIKTDIQWNPRICSEQRIQAVIRFTDGDEPIEVVVDMDEMMAIVMLATHYVAPLTAKPCPITQE